MSTPTYRELPLATYRAMVERASDHMIVLGAGGEIMYVSRELEPGLRAAVERRRAELVADGDLRQEMECELGVESRNGARRWYEMRTRRLELGRGEEGLLLVLRDISPRRRAETELEQTAEALAQSRRQMLQAQKMESVGRLAGGVAHDFNNMLTSIISFARFVMDDMAPGDPRREDLVEVLKAADRASRLTSQLLAFSRQRKVEPVVVDLNEALSNADRVLRRLVEEQVELVVLPCDRPMHVLVDPGQLDQVLMNLVVNSRDAMPAGGSITVRLETKNIERHSELSAGRYAMLSVTDTGTGMSAEVIGKVFEPFFSTKGEKGTGLGLATVYGIVMQAGGHVDVWSEPGKGTKFAILLPLTDVDATTVAPSVAPSRRRKLTGVALAVEDQPAILRTIVRSISGVGFNVLHAHSAEEALALVDDLDPRVDLLVTDVMLPGLSGLRLAERLRERTPELRVVFCSGYMDQHEDTEIPQDDRTAFLAKPFTGVQLVSRATDLFGGR